MEIKDIEYFLPNQVLSNNDLENQFPNWDSKKIESKIGISERHIVQKNETALDLGEEAAKKVLSGFDKKDIDFLLFCTQSPDYFIPTSACILQERLHLETGIGALDYNLGCSGYIYGLALAKGLLLSKVAKNVLLVVAETYSKHIYGKDIANLALFGDGAAATRISSDSQQDKLGNFVLGTDGIGFKNLIVKHGGFRHNLEYLPKEIDNGTESKYTENHLYMNGPEIFNFTIEKIPGLIEETLEKNNFVIEDVDYFIFHQANKYMLNYLRRKIKIPKNKFYNNINNTGNTVSATIPIALKNCINDKLVVKGNKIMLVGFGVGYSWGSTIITL